jgi:Icc-related predicted phosphoesterase
MTLTRVLFCTDVHGSETVYRKFLNASKMYKADVAIIGGDITGKGLALISNRNGTYDSDLLGRRWSAQNENELQGIIKEFRKRGYYIHIAEPTAVEEVRSSRQKAEEILQQEILKTVKEWVQLAEERLKDAGVKCYISPGNDDVYEIDAVLDSSDFVVNPEAKVITLADRYEMATLGNVNITPWNCPRDVTEEKLSEMMNELLSKINNHGRAIFNLHAPPYDTYLDVAPELNKDLKPVIKAGQPNMIHVGSASVRKAIEKYQPLLGLHGHIHESKAAQKIGRTICLNPGSSYSEGVLNAAIVLLKDDEAKEYMFVGG